MTVDDDPTAAPPAEFEIPRSAIIAVAAAIVLFFVMVAGVGGVAYLVRYRADHPSCTAWQRERDRLDALVAADVQAGDDLLSYGVHTQQRQDWEKKRPEGCG